MSKPPPTTRLWIASTWDGEPLAEGQRARVDLRLGEHHLEIEVEAPYLGDPAPPGPPGSTDRLWEYEVVEVFVAGPGDDSAVETTEIEISPHGHHLVLRLRGVRQPWASGLPLDLETRIVGERWRARARLDLHLLPTSPWRVNAYAIHGPPPTRYHHAAFAVPGPTPDFHRPEHFAPWDPARGLESLTYPGASQPPAKR